MGKFYGPSKKGESILAMCTDVNNHYLICGDTQGEIRIWNIEHYCCSIISPVLFESSKPLLVHSWQAHLSPIIFCEWTDYKGNGDFILTGSTDHTTRLWTMNGEQIGIFGQRQTWDIEVLITARIEMEEEQKREKSARKFEDNENGLNQSKLYRKSSLDTKSIISEKTNPILATELTEELDKRPFSSSTAQMSDVSKEKTVHLCYYISIDFYRMVNYLNRLQLYLKIHHYQ
jgi:hypothetical protein